MGYDRRRAVALKAADAKRVINLSLPFVLKKMTYAQIAQVQRILDAAVVNTAVQKEYRDLYEKSVVARSGGMVIQDPNKARRADRVFESQIPSSEADKHIRLNFEALLAPEALTPRTDNPDEAAYLNSVKKMIKTSGVWLRVHQPHFRDPNVPSNYITDARRWEVYLSLGYNGEKIRIENGQITREALLEIGQFAKGYLLNVHHGPVQKTLEREIKRLQREIEAGEDQHNMLAKIRTEGPVQVSERLGGADFPSKSIWNLPRQLLRKAVEIQIAGNVSGCQAYLLAAAVLTRSSARMLGRYIDEMSIGGERAVSVLKVFKTAGEIAAVGLAVTTVVGAVRGAGSAGAGAAARGSVDDAAERVVQQYVRKNPGIADDLAGVRLVPGPKGSVAGGVKPGTSSGAGTGSHKW